MLKRFRIRSNGDLQITKLAGSGNKVVYTDNNGILKTIVANPWMTDGNTINPSTDFIGTINNADFVLKTYSNYPVTMNREVMRLTTSLQVGIGTQTPVEKLEVAYGNILVRGLNNFAVNTDAVLYLGDNYHFIKSTNGKGVTIGTWDGTLPQSKQLQSNKYRKSYYWCRFNIGCKHYI